MKKNIQAAGVLLSMTTLLVSCGANKSSNNDRNTLIEEAQREAEMATLDGSNIQGRYIAKFETLNSHVVGTIPGSAQFKRENNSIYAYLRLFAGSPSIGHFQNVHIGNRCPTMNDDTNGDGYLDYQEAIAVVGPVIIPLDWDIGSQTAGNSIWPKAFPNGSYEYLKVANFNRFWDDLNDPDRNTEDNIVKLEPNKGLVITGKVVLIQGVEEIKNLPDSVAGNGRWKNYQTFPIACGVFKPTTEETGVIYEDRIPGPIGPVVEGQDTPAPEGADEIPGTGTVIVGPSNSAGSNDSRPDNGDDRPETSAPSESPESENSPTPSEEGDDGICWPWERDCR